MATILITGTNRGIGLEFTKQCLARGDRVIATCRNIEAADGLKQLQGSHDELEVRQLDVASPESMQELVQQLADTPIDIFINNAGVYGPPNVKFGEVDAQVWASVLQVNSIAPLMLSQLLMPNLRQGKDKKMLYLTSKMGSIDDNSGGGSYIYRSSKTALNSVVKSLAIDLAAEGFSAAVLHPGWVLTDMGGPNALIDTETSVTGMLKVVDDLDPQSSGSFFNYDGSIIAW
ncbi:MAG: short-chain dehydrogenase [SAR86 cluster bacterium]|uniref:Short-chain dehydrogenase n=1 Tax=SAR86 cluster bacterium TaxID=2030880 RepID=A0A2A4WZT1_9GAMM|nr:MAG: short-chain dehydrogenase [SAR86 cluster bacterium]